MNSVRIFLCGDVMTGRGVDQVLAHPGDPALREDYVPDARTYIAMAQKLNGPIPVPVEPDWPWGDALETLNVFAPDLRVINVETAVTHANDFDTGKAVHYRMNPANVACLMAARPDVCSLANNHVLDFGPAGLSDTLETLRNGGLRTVGAGRDIDEAEEPAVIPLAGGNRAVVFAFGTPSSGIPPRWAARADRPGVNLIRDLSTDQAARITHQAAAFKRRGDIVIVSIHWGSNWGYEVPSDHREFAHRLIDGGVDVVYGHSAHHPRPIEVYQGKLVLYGVGDFIDDYEGIQGYETYRDDLRLMYFVSLDGATLVLAELRMVAMQARRMRLHRASLADCKWLNAILNKIGARFGTHIDLADDGTLRLLCPTE